MREWLVGDPGQLGAVVAKAVLIYAVALLGLRVAHRRTLSQWTAIDFAAAVAIGSILRRTAVAEGQSFLVGATALLTILTAHYVVTIGRYRDWFARVVDHGRLRHDQLRACGLTENDVLAKLRQQGVGDVGDLRYVLYETKGELTVVREPGGDRTDPPLVQEGLRSAADHPGPSGVPPPGPLREQSARRRQPGSAGGRRTDRAHGVAQGTTVTGTSGIWRRPAGTLRTRGPAERRGERLCCRPRCRRPRSQAGSSSSLAVEAVTPPGLSRAPPGA